MEKTRKEKIIAYLLVLFGAIVYISLIFNNNIWLDEGFTANLVYTDMAGVLQRSMNDTLPPLYNIILKLMTDILGYKIFVMKLTSVIPMLIVMMLGASVVRKRFGAITSYLFILAIIVMPNMIYYGVEIRMYSLGFLFATGSGIYAYEVLMDSNRKNWIIFTLFSVLAGYSHHFAFVTVGFVYLFLLLYYFFFERNHIKRWLYCLLATFIIYFPCMLVTLKQLKSVSGYFSMPEVTPSVFVKYARFPYTVGCTPVTILLAVIMLALIVFFVIKKDKEKKDYYAFLCFVTYYGVLIFGTIVSKLMTANIFVDRYLFFAMGLLWMFPAIFVGSMAEDKVILKLSAKKIMYGLLAFEIIIGICSYVREYQIEYQEGCDELIAFLRENVKEDDILCTDESNEELKFCLQVYSPGLEYSEEFLNAINLANEKSATVWLAENVAEAEDYNLSSTDLGKEASELEEKLQYVGDYSFDRYTFSLFKMSN